MWYWWIALILVLSASALVASRPRTGAERSLFPDGKGISLRKILGMSRGEVETMLDSLERKDEPEPVFGAMCYEPVAAPSNCEYICPVCGERTLYSDYTTVMRVEGLPATRELFDRLRTVTPMDVRLDEVSFCSVCGGGDSLPAPVLIVDLSDAEPCSSEVSDDDLRLLLGFLSGEASYATVNDGTLPLKPQMQRIRRLLGLPEESL